MNLLIYFGVCVCVCGGGGWGGVNFAFGAEICLLKHGSLSICMLRALFMCILLIFC